MLLDGATPEEAGFVVIDTTKKPPKVIKRLIEIGDVLRNAPQ